MAVNLCYLARLSFYSLPGRVSRLSRVKLQVDLVLLMPECKEALQIASDIARYATVHQTLLYRLLFIF